MVKNQYRWISISLASSVLVACGGAESDSKLNTSTSSTSSASLSGVVLDGYLHNAKVCLDKNNNAICDSGDGEVALTDAKGNYQLSAGGDVSGYNLLVEAIPGQTIDMDNPNQPIQSAFTLEVPATAPAVISPLTTMIASVADSSGISFSEATQAVASEIGVDSSLINADYAALNTPESRKVHMLARGVTRVLQSAQDESMNSGVSQENARKGSKYKLAQLDVAALKQKTDKLSHGSQSTTQALEQLGKQYQDQLKITPQEINGDTIVARPPAPRNGQVNDSADTFDWNFVLGFKGVKFYEYSLDNGVTWAQVTTKPLSVGRQALPIGTVQVRIAASQVNKTSAGTVLKSEQAFTLTSVPAAPGQINVNNALNTFGWTLVDTYSDVGEYEYSLDNGQTWTNTTSNPQAIADINIATGSLLVRVSEDASTGRPHGLVARSTQEMTVTPAKPQAPTLDFVNDATNQISWNKVAGYPSLTDYEINLGTGWENVTALPYRVGNKSIPAGTIQVRVKNNSTDARPAGAVLTINTEFTQSVNQPAAPTSPVIDNANNTFGWTLVPGYSEHNLYEYSVDGGITFVAVSANPQPIADLNYQVGKVCVRVQSNTNPQHDPGELLCSDKAYSVTPVQPAAPSNLIVNDALDTLGWALLPEYSAASDYEINPLGSGWVSVNAIPYQLSDQAYPIGSVQVRVKANPVDGRPEGLIASNRNALTVRPSAPVAPTSLITDDTANTLDWAFVGGFDQAALYEISLDSGSNWTQVLSKPIVIGDINKSIGDIQLRVSANPVNGMPSGAQASNTVAFTETPKLPAPANAVIVNTFTGYNPIQTNGFKWDYLTAQIGGKSVTFDEPEYYEFTRDQGLTWHPVVSRPQFVGSEAYDKPSVGIRLKENAITGQKNVSSNVLWATGSTSRFIALQYVPMKTKTLAANYSSYDNSWSTYGMNCIAEYDAQGQGEPTFWAGSINGKADTIFTLVAAADDCGITGWTLPKFSEVITLSNRSLPSQFASYLITDSKANLWADKNGVAVTITKGSEVTPSQWSSKYAYPKWQLAPTADLVTNVSSANTAIIAELKTQGSTISNAESYLTTWLSDNQNQSKSYAALEVKAQAKVTQLKAFSQPWADQYTAAQSKLNEFEFQAHIAKNRSDAQSQSFVADVTTYKQQVTKLQQNLNGLNALIEGATFAQKMATVQIKSDALTAATNTLNSASLASEIHQATLNLYSAIFDIEAQYAQVNAFIDSLNASTNHLDSSFSSLLSLYQQFISEINTTAAIHDVVQSKTLATDGLKRANNNGFSVTKADSLVNNRFAKLDELGHYLPSATTFQQGWRCTEDTQASGKRRVWSLLKDGLPNGKDDLAYDASSAGIASVLGSNELLESTNTKQLCGFSDWKVPHVAQLLSIKTKAVTGSSDKVTLDSDVFPNHFAMLPEYDKSSYSGGVRFYYWTNTSKQSQQYIMSYDTAQNSETITTTITDGSENKVVLARLMREISNTYELLDTNGSVIQDRSSAICARDKNSGLVWQLFSVGDGTRFKKYIDAQPLLTAQSSNNVCGKSTWRYPTKAELYGLIPLNTDTFKFNDASDGGYSYYITSDTGLYNRPTALDMNTMNETDVSTQNYGSAYLYRFVAD
ncbi:DUF1566 domain-containing protein [Vibrio makurazakiensis]|uniref:DUF1566 domain-containing protein n=1 Tax=Vibrio makurazakiensis TaxID=2910250 RepID=UPI003D10D104